MVAESRRSEMGRYSTVRYSPLLKASSVSWPV